MKDKYKVLILSCWAVLLVCFIIKLFGGNYFEIVAENEYLSSLNGTVIDRILSFCLYYLGTEFYLRAVCKIKYCSYKIYLPVIITWFIKLMLINYPIIGFALDTILMIGLPIVLTKKIIRPILGYLLTFVFQLITLITKNLGLQIVTNNIVVALVYTIDYYVMIYLYYLYSIRKEEQ